MLAYMRRREQLISTYVKDDAEATAIEVELERIRKRGYAESRNELIEGACAVASPFFNREGEVAGSIGIFGPEARLVSQKVKELGLYLVAEAAKLSHALGYMGTLPQWRARAD